MTKKLLIIIIILSLTLPTQVSKVKGEQNTYTLQVIINDYFNESLAGYPLEVVLKSNTTEIRPSQPVTTGQVTFCNLSEGTYILTVYSKVPISKVVYNGTISITSNLTTYINCKVMRVKIVVKTIDNVGLSSYTLEINNHIYGNDNIILPINETYKIKVYYNNKEIPLLMDTIKITPNNKIYYLTCNARLKTVFKFNYYDGSSIPESTLETISVTILYDGEELPLIYNSSSGKFYLNNLIILGKYDIKIFYRGEYLGTFSVEVSSVDLITLNIPLLKEVEIKISDSQGKGIPYAHIKIEWANKVIWEGVTDSLGKITFNNIPKGKELKVTIKVGDREYIFWKSFNTFQEKIFINLFSLKLTFTTPEKTKIPPGSKVVIKYNGKTLFCYEYTSGYLVLDYLPPGVYEVAVYWRNTLVAYDKITLNTNIEKNIVCKIYNLTIIVKNIPDKYLNRIKIKISGDNDVYQEIVPLERVVLLPWLPYGKYNISIVYLGNFSKVPLINESILLQSTQVVSFILPVSSLAISAVNYWGEKLSKVNVVVLVTYNGSLVDKYNLTSVSLPIYLDIVPRVKGVALNITVMYKRFKKIILVDTVSIKSDEITMRMNEVFVEILGYPLTLIETVFLIIGVLILIAGICWFIYNYYYLGEYEEVELIEEEEESYEEEEESEYEY